MGDPFADFLACAWSSMRMSPDGERSWGYVVRRSLTGVRSVATKNRKKKTLKRG
jgi:hypothetical protein